MIRTLALICLATPALADVDGVLDHHILPRIDHFTETATTLADTTCDVPALRAGFAETAQAWAGVSHLNMGPIQDGGRAKAVLFWPDDRDATARGLRLLQAQGAEALTPEALAQASVAARGLGALERQIFENEAQPCDVTLALADDLAATATTIRDGWHEDFADQMRNPGQDGHLRFLTKDEVNQSLYTVLLAGMEYLADQRLGRPLGSFDDPRPLRAELRRSEQSLPMIQTQIVSLRELSAQLGDAPLTDAAFARAQDQAGRLADPALADVNDPAMRFRAEAVQTTIKEAQALAQEELGKALNVQVGFNAADGD